MKKRIWNCLYNLDRATASLIWGTSQETVSSMSGRMENKSKAAKKLATILDKIQVHHVETAIKHADALDKADSDVWKHE